MTLHLIVLIAVLLTPWVIWYVSPGEALYRAHKRRRADLRRALARKDRTP